VDGAKNLIRPERYNFQQIKNYYFLKTANVVLISGTI